MESKKPLNFAQALRTRPSTTPETQKSTDTESQLSTIPESQHATVLASQNATAPESDFPPASQLPTTPLQPASKLAKPRTVESHRRRKVDSRKGDRHRGDKVPFNTRISGETFNRIKHFCIDRGLEQQEFAELAAIHFIEAVESQKAGVGDSRQALDDRELMILFKTHPSIINLYLQYNPENRWKPADDYEGQRYNDRDIRLIEFGIIQTQFNARFKKINSFKYYLTEIEIALETPLTDETIEVMLKHARRRWEAAKNPA